MATPEVESDDVRGEPSAQDSGSARRDDALAIQLSELARSLQVGAEPLEVLSDIVQAAIHIIPGVDEASISVVANRSKVTSLAPSSEFPRLVDAAQQ